MNITFVITSILLGVGLAMDAFSVSIANGLSDPDMKASHSNLIAGTFAFFQFAMPMLGWVCVHTIAETFTSFQKFIPWIALILLGYIGIGLLVDGIKSSRAGELPETEKLSIRDLIIQGIATSIDALSVGFTIAEYGAVDAFICSLIIAVVTYIICMVGLKIGKRFGMKLAGRATIVGGIILIAIGLEIFIKGVI